MTDELKKVLDQTNEAMNKAYEHTVNEYTKIRAGKASPAMLDGVHVDYYGSMMSLSQVANVNTPDAKTIVVQPWEKPMLQPIEKAIMEANLGFNPQNDGTLIRVPVPPLTEERRKALVKQVKAEAEQSKISLRNIRKDANERIKKLQKDGLPEDEAKSGEDKVQIFTDSFIKKVDELTITKEKEIMTV